MATIPYRPSIVQSALLFLAILAAPSPGHVIYVNGNAQGPQDGTSWQSAFRSLQSALAIATSGDQIWVAQGTYRPSENLVRSTPFELRTGVAIYGGFAGTETDLQQRDPTLYVTTLTGDLAGDDSASLASIDDNSLHVVRADYVGSSAILDGFAIVAGNANSAATWGAGILIYGGSPAIANCTLAHNHAISVSGSANGGAVYCADSARPNFTNCLFESNRTGFLDESAPAYLGDSGGDGGAVYCINASPVFVRCVFSRNGTGRADSLLGSDGGAVFCSGSAAPTFSSCFFHDNFAARGGLGGGVQAPAGGDGGAVCNDGGAPRFINCAFTDNRAGHGGYGFLFTDGGPGGNGGAICNRSGSLSLLGCLLVNNRSGAGGPSERDRPGPPGNGGGLFNGATASIVNATIVSNQTFGAGGGISTDPPAVVQIDNCVLWDNRDSDAVNFFTQIHGFQAPSSLNYSCVLGYAVVFGGVGNIGDDPQFDTPASGDYRLSADSPCIDAASNAALPAELTTDLDGRPRRVDDPATPDSGAGTPPIVDMGAYEYQGACPDFDGNSDVNLADLAILLAHFGTPSGATFADGDTDADGDVDLADLAVLLARFGAPCG